MRQRLTIGYLLALLLLGWHVLAQAQGQPTCASSRVNAQGTSGASVTVDATAGGILVAEANTSRCTLLIISETTNPMRCGPSTGKYPVTVSATVGALWPISTSPQFILGMQAQEAWRCFRTTGTSNTVSIIEGLP